jgi:hypothetical protein
MIVRLLWDIFEYCHWWRTKSNIHKTTINLFKSIFGLWCLIGSIFMTILSISHVDEDDLKILRHFWLSHLMLKKAKYSQNFLSSLFWLWCFIGSTFMTILTTSLEVKDDRKIIARHFWIPPVMMNGAKNPSKVTAVERSYANHPPL